MEPFQLVCQSCAAKLKVKNRSAIGQRLACPRCREMILVQAPEGHDIGESLSATGSFDEMDMDSILENRPPEPKKPKVTPRPTPQPPRPRTVTPANPLANPELAPGQEWVNPTTKKKQRLVLVIMAAVGSLLILAAVVVSILNWSGSPRPEVASSSDADLAKVADTDSPDEESDPNLVSNTTPENVDLIAKDTESDELQSEPVSDVPPEIGNAPPIAGIPSMPPEVAIDDAKLEGFGDPTTAEKKPPAAEPDAKLLDPVRRKDQILLGVKYQQLPLQTVLHELSAISGLILTIDVPSIAAAGIDFNPVINLKTENESTATVIRRVAESVGLVAVETDDGFWITIEDDGQLKKLDVSIAVIVENEEEAQEIIRAIKALVYPNSWKNDAADANDAVQPKPAGTIAYADGKLQLENTSGAIREIQSFVEAIKASAQSDLKSSAMLNPVVWLDSGAFVNAYDGENSIRIPVSKFFQKLAKENGVQVIADW